MRKLISYMVFWGVFLALSSCIQEDLDKCFSGIRLKFHFDLHEEGLEGTMKSVHVFLFDTDSVLRVVQEGKGDCLVHNFTMNMDVSPGTYTLVAFGCDDTDFYHSYNDGHISEQVAGKYDAGVTIGKTTLSDLRIFLKSNLSGSGETEQRVPAAKTFDDLFYGISGIRQKATSEYEVKEVVVPQQTIVDQDIDLIRNTSVLKLTVRGVKKLHSGGVANIDIYALGTNDCYTWHNRLAGMAGKIKFLPDNISFGDDSLQLDIRVQRLEYSRTVSPVILYLCDKTTGAKRYELDVVKTLLQAKDGEGRYIYSDQEDIDRIYNHPIDLLFDDNEGKLVIRIFVQGWEVKNIYPVM